MGYVIQNPKLCVKSAQGTFLSSTLYHILQKLNRMMKSEAVWVSGVRSFKMDGDFLSALSTQVEQLKISFCQL